MPSNDPLHARDHPNIDCWPRGPAKVCRPQNEAAVKRLIDYNECLQDDLPRLQGLQSFAGPLNQQ